MFYPADSLRRGGRFYLLWMADSWPHRFASISHRQLWSQDVRKLCDELKEVMISESGRPTHRYSLRLSSQLMRGLVRLYQRKVSVFLSDLCMIHANVIRSSNKKYNIQDVTERAVDRPQLQVMELGRRTVLLVEEPENEERIEKILQNSGNVVAHIQDITLREPVIAEPVPPPNDGFGEENAEQALQFLNSRRSVELMLAGEQQEQVSALGGVGDTTGAAGDLTVAGDTTRVGDRDMERMSGQDLTMLRPSDGGLMSITDFGKEIPEIPDVPILPIPEMPDPQEKQQETAVEIPEVPIEQPREDIRRTRDINTIQESTQIELEELEEIEPRAKRRRKLIIDKKIEIISDVLRARIQNPRIELRCEDSSEAIIDLQVPYELYMNRPARAGFRERSNLALCLTRLFMRNLGVIHRDSPHRDLEEEDMLRQQRNYTRSHLEIIRETAELIIPELQIEKPQETTAIEYNLPLEVDISKGPNVAEQEDISDLVTQKLETLSQQREGEKRCSDGATPSPKRQKSAGYLCLRENQQRPRGSDAAMAIREADKLPELEIEVDKENIAANQQRPVKITKRTQENVTAMLHEAGLSDMPSQVPMEIEPLAPQTKQSRGQGSESSESLLGSLDRTKVSLGDSDTTTDSKRFIRDQWGAEGTMLKIIKCINDRNRGETITIRNLIARGPIIQEYKNIITAKCFSSILKLKQHGFIAIKKCPTTLEVLDIMLGPNFQTGTCV